MSGSAAMREIRQWTDEILLSELRSSIRARLGVDAYILLFAEVTARLLERTVAIDAARERP